MRLLFPVLMTALLSACAMPIVSYPPPTDPNACGAPGLQRLIGMPATVIPPTGVWASIRIIHPGDIVTMDYSPIRLNVYVDAANRITRLTCG